MQTWTIESKYVRAEIQALGGMVGPAVFHLPTGDVQPFAVGHWGDDSGKEYDALPPILKRLRGEWPCVPFGFSPPQPPSPAWIPQNPAQEFDPRIHGYCANAEWSCIERTGNSIVLEIIYPDDHPVQSVRRTVAAAAERSSLLFSIEIATKTACEMPIGIHPNFAIDGPPGSFELRAKGGTRCWTTPIEFIAGVSKNLPDTQCESLAKVPLVNGGFIDMSHLPLPYITEELAILTEPGGVVSLLSETGKYKADVIWDTNAFPTCVLWFSNKGRSGYPWNSRFQCIGIEPICAAFDLGTPISLNRDNPMARTGIPCFRAFEAGEVFSTRYEVALHPLC